MNRQTNLKPMFIQAKVVCTLPIYTHSIWLCTHSPHRSVIVRPINEYKRGLRTIIPEDLLLSPAPLSFFKRLEIAVALCSDAAQCNPQSEAKCSYSSRYSHMQSISSLQSHLTIFINQPHHHTKIALSKFRSFNPI